MITEIDWKSRYDQEHARFCELSGLICALQIVADELGGTPIEDQELALRRNALCGIANAMTKAADLPA